MVTLVSSPNIVLANNGFGPQLWGDGVTLSAFDWDGNPAAVVYDDQFRVFGFGIAGGRYNQIDFHEGFGNISERMEIDFGGAVTDVVIEFGQLERKERGRRESGKWTAYGLDGSQVGEALFDPQSSLLGSDVGVNGSSKQFPIPIELDVPFAKVVIEAFDFDRGEGRDPFIKTKASEGSYLPAPYEENSDFNIVQLSYTRVSTVVTEPPEVTDDTFVVDEDAELVGNVLANDTDPEGESLSANLQSAPSDGMVNLASDGGFTYLPDSDFNGVDSFTYQALDGEGGVSQGVVTITVNPINDAPVAVEDVAFTQENTSVSINAADNDTDVDGNLVPGSAVVVTTASNGDVSNDGNGIFVYTPANGFDGEDSFTYRIFDAAGAASEETTVAIAVAVNQPPTASDDFVNTQVDTLATFNVLTNDNDAEGDPLSVASVDVNAASFNGTLVNNGEGSFTYTPDAGFIGTDVFSYTISDSQGGTDTATVNITVNDVPPPSPRVTAQLLALYTFEEGGGSLVQDVSGVGNALDLVIDEPSNVTWGDGILAIDASTLIASDGAASKLIDGLTGTNEITVEAWLSTDDLSQSGPARIVSLSSNTRRRNFTLGQDDSAFDMRLRTTSTNSNGTRPSASSPDGAIAANELTHVVYTRDANGLASFYVNNELVKTQTISGSFDNWDDSYRLGLANELTGDRPWLGTLDLVAIYNQSFDSIEVSQNFLAGPDAG